MKTPNNFYKPFVLTICLLILSSFSFGQYKTMPEPREEKLLNNLKVLIWNNPDTDKVTVKLRIHSGSVFDIRGKVGTMALLRDILLANDEIAKLFTDDLGGSIAITGNYDYMQITATTKASEFLTVMQTIAPLIVNPTIDKKTTALVKAKRLKMLKVRENITSYVADMEIRGRLFGDFPYGNPIAGTTESLSKIDFADILLAKQRFMTADNATLTINGNVRSAFAYRVARRLFGSWSKSDGKVRPTFRLPDEPDQAPLVVNVDNGDFIEDRYAINSVSVNDKDYYASAILSEILDMRFKKLSKANGLNNTRVENHAYFLRGYFVFGYGLRLKPDAEIISPSKNDELIKRLFAEKISAQEFALAKFGLTGKLGLIAPEDFWLFVDTYHLDSVKKEVAKIEKVMITDVQRLANVYSKKKIAHVSVSPLNSETIPDSVKDADPDDPKK